MDTFSPLSRPRNPNAETVELRFHVPTEWANLMDGYSMGDEQARNALAKRIVSRWVKKEAHRAILIERTVGGNPVLSDLAGMDAE